MAAQTVLVTKLTGQAWMRGPDGNLTVLHEGMRIPADAEIVTASGSTVQLQADGQPPLIVGENQDVHLTADLVQPPTVEEAAVASPASTEIDQIIAAINAGGDPFDELDPTAATLSGGSEGGSTFVRLSSIIEAVSPLALEYGRSAPVTTVLPLFSGVGALPEGTDQVTPTQPTSIPQASADSGVTFEDAVSALQGNVLSNDKLGEGSITEHRVALVGADQGLYGKIILNADGSYSYQLDNGLKAVQALAEGETLVETFTYTLVDKDGASSTATLTVTIVGTNDAPVLSGNTDGAVVEDGATTATGKLDVSDVDTTDTHTWSVNNGGKGSYGSFSVDGSGNWTYNLDNANKDVQALKTGQSITESFTVTVDDGHGGKATQVVTVTINGTDDGAIITPAQPGDDKGTVTEDVTLSTGGQLTVTDPDAGQAVFLPQTNAAGQHGSFSIDADGKWSYQLNNGDAAVQGLGAGKTLTETFTVTTADGTTGQVVVTIVGTNDAPVLTGKADGAVTEDGTLVATGKLDVSDVDTTDTHTWSVNNGGKGSYGSFSVDGSGNWTYNLDNANKDVQALKTGQSITESFTVTVDDGHGGKATQVVTVTINGTDDGAIITPAQPGDDKGTVTEDVTLSTGGQLTVTDPDAGQAVFLPQTNAAGQHGSFSIDADGKWSYQLNNGDAAVQGLGAGKTLTETFTVTTADGTTGQVVVTIVGTNDAPVLTGKADGAVTEDGTLVATGKLDVSDVDTTDTHTWSVNNGGKGSYGSFSVDGSGNWTYNLDNANKDVQALKTGQSITESFTVTVDDGHGGKATQVVTVTINGTDDGAIITPAQPGDDKGTVTEDVTLSTGGQLTVTDPDAGQAVFLPQTNAAGQHGSFSIDADGKWSYQLNNGDAAVQGLGAGKTLTETFTVTTADGTTGQVVVTIVGTNDAPVLTGKADGAVTEDGTLVATGKLDVSDVDTTDTHTWSVNNGGKGSYGSFSVDGSGNWTYNLDNANKDVQALKTGQSITESFTVTVDDGHGGKATQVVTVTINGTDDGAIITPAQPGDDKGTVTEDVTLSTGGQLTVTDPDAGQAVFLPQTNAAGQHGSFSIDADGKWSYQLNNGDAAVQGLGAGKTLTETFTVTTADGTTGQVVVTIVGTNDAPVLTGKADGAVTEDGTLVATGKLDVSDVDTTDTHTWSVNNGGKGSYGSFSVDGSGNWTYNLDNANKDVQALKTGQSITESFTVTVDDGHGGKATQVVTVTINGTDDGAIITPAQPGDDKGTVTEDVTLSTGGQLTVTDPDAGQAVFLPQTNAAGQHGSFSIDADGKWSYQLNNGDAAVQGLGAGKTLTETFTVTTADGTTGQVVVTIVGTNDAPVLTGKADGAVTEDGTLVATGKLDVSDVDTTDTHTWSVNNGGKGSYGSFSVDGSGNWTYNLDNANKDVQALKTGQSITESFTVTVDDGHGGKATQVVTVTINGTDDGAIITPAQPGDDKGTVTEDVTLSTGGQLTVTDPDAGQAVFLPQTNAAGQHGSFSIDADGKWSYQLNNGDAAVQGLGAGKTLTETFTVTTADGTTGQVVVTIVGTNDAPVLTGKADGAVTEDGTLVATGKLDVSDVDTTDTHTWSVNNGGKGSYGSFSVDGSGNWTYNLDNANKDVQALKTGQSITESFTVTVDDGHGGKATQVVTVTINGTDDGAIITPAQPGDDKGTVTEDVTLSTGGQLTVTDPDAGQAVFLPQTNAAGQHGSFSIDADGKWSYQLNNGDAAVQGLGAGKTLTETFTVTTADGTTGQVVVTIVGTNDAPVLTGKADGAVTEDGTLVATGKLDVSDVDTTDTHTWSVNNGGKGSYGSFSVDGSGNWTYNLDNANKDVQALKTGQSITESFTVTVDDGHGGKATQVVTVTINGTDDGAIITPAQPGDDKGTVTEDVTLSTGGQLTVTDPDAGQAVFLPQTNAAGQHGSFSIDADGKWSYQLNNGDAAVQGLGAGKTLTETFTVTTADGTTGQVVVTIVGTNDAPVLTGKADGAVTEDGTLVATGKLDVSDVDTTDTHTWSVNNGGKGSYGSFSVDGSGNWTYNLDNANKDVQALKTGQSITESFTVTVDDGHGGKATQVVTVTINGTDDGAIITPAQPGDDKGTVTEDVTLSTGGQLTVTDPDAGQAVFLPQTNAAGQHGSFSIDADGKWSYQLNNGDAAVQGLGAGKTLTETFTVTTADGTTGQVVVTIVGTNDAPVLTGKADGAVTEDGTLVATGKLDVSDVDTTDTHTWSVNNGGKGSYGSFSVDGSGNWTYNLDNANKDVQALKTGQSITESFTVTVDDGHGGKATQVVTVTINGTDDGAIITPAQPGDDKGTVTEDVTLSTGGQLTVTDPDAGQAVFLPQTNAAGQHGSFSIDADGKWSYQLNNGDAAVQGLGAGKTLTETFTVTTADGTTGQVVVTIVGTNDAPVLTGKADGAVTEDGTLVATGKLDVSDVDTTDTHTWSVNNGGKGSYGSFSVDGSGNWTYNLDNANKDVQALKTGQSITESFTVTVDDGHGGKATQVVTVTINGTDDGAIITPAQPGDDKGTVTEDVTLSTGGQLTVTDPDAGQAVFLPQTNAAGQHGSFSIDADGKWSYQLNNGDAAVQGLGAGKTLTETFTVTTADGTTGQVVVTIVGTNDAPVLTGKADGAVTEDGTLVATGKLDVSDVDTTDTHTWSVNNGGKGSYGSFSVDGSGNWTYNLDNANKDVQALKTGQSITESFTVTVDDGHGGKATQVVTVTINGTDDGAIITPAQPGDDKGTVTEDVTLSTGGQLTVTDPDAGQAVFLPQTNAAGQHGSFSIDADGKWSYQLNNGDAAVQGLGAGKTLTETFTVTTADGTTGQVVVTIVGTNDAPVLTGKADGAVTEDGTLVATGKLDVSDVDTTDTHTWSVNNGGKGSYGSFSVDGSGNWTYNLDNANKDVQALKTGQSITESFTVTVDDGHGGKATQVVTVTINGTDDGAIITPAQPGDDKGTVTEDVTLSTGGQLTVTDPDAGQAVFLPQTNAAGQHGSFSIDADGKWSYQLNNGDAAVQGLGAGKTLTETFTVTTADGTTGQVVVTIVGTNDAPVLTGKADGAVTEDGTLVATGKLDVSDVDTTDTHTWSVNNGGKGSYGSFSVDGSGNWTYNLDNANKDVQALKTGQSITESFTVTVDDGHGGKATQVVTVTINGTDDGAIITPAQPGDDKGTVTEDVTLSTGGQLTVTDPDAGQAVFLPQTNAAGQHGSFSIDADGKWSYQLNNGDAAVQGLGAGKTLTETFTVTTADGTTGQVVVTIVGTNDAPVLTGKADGAVTEDGTLVATGKLDVSDVDTTDTHTWSVNNGGKGSYGSFSVDGSGNWTYNLDNANKDVQALKTGQSITESFTVTVDDGHGGKATQVVTVTINGTDDGAIITPAQPGDDKGTVTEDVTLSTGGQLTVTDPDAGQAVFLPQTNAAGQHGSFSIDADGKWSYQLNNGDAAVQGLGVGKTLTETFTVTTADGTTGQVVVTIVGTNDAPVLTGKADGAVTEDGTLVATGKLDVSDVDTTDTHTWSVNNGGKGSYGSFSVDGSGNWTYNLDNANKDVQALKTGQSITESFTVTVDDGHGGKATQVVTVTINGTDDGAIITPAQPGDDKGTVTEDVTLSTGGQLTVTDPDAGQAVFLPQTNAAGQHGSFSIDADGKWSYQLNNGDAAVQGLGAGKTLTETFTVTTADGTTGQVVVTIVGTNDAPVLTGKADGAVTEDGTLVATGKLDVSDVDTTDTHTWSVNNGGKGSYGSFSVDGSGNWTYNLDNANKDVQALKTGQSITESFTVTVDDGHGGKATQVVTVTINGTDDGAIITPAQPGDDKGTVTEDVTLSTGGQLTVTDPDAGQAVFLPQTNAAGQHGSFSIDADGKWSYQLNNGDAAVQGLGAGKTLTETFTVTTADGTTGQVVVTIVGTNDAPVLTGKADGAVTEDGTLVATGKLDVSDVDTTDTHTWSVNNGGKGSYGSFSVDGSGNWTYNLDNANKDVQALKTGQSITESFTVTVDDGHGGKATQVVTVTINGTDDGAIITPAQPGDDKGTVTEDVTLSTGGQLTVTDPDAGQAVFLPQTNAAGQHGSFSIDADGKWSYQLNNGDAAVQGLGAGKTLTETFTVTTADGTTGQVVVTIVGTNDAPVLTGKADGAVTEDGTLVATGKLDVSDVDTTDTHTWSVNNGGKGSYGSFSVDGSGNWTYNLDNANKDVQALKTGQSITESFTVTVDDGHGGKATQVVTVTINGTDDGAIITPAQPGDDKGTVTEDVTLSTGGQLTVTDPDAGQAVFLPQTNAAGQHGSFSIDADGKWSYQLNNGDAAVQGLGAGKTLTETFTVTTADGTTGQVVVTIVGTNDAPVLTGKADGAVTEDGTLVATGKLDVSDVDTTDTHTWSVNNGGKGSYGSFSVDGSGNWTYNLDNANKDVQALKTGQSITESFTVTVDDGHGGKATQVVTVTINGTDDGAIITPAQPGDDKGTVTEDVTLSTGGQLTVTDPDAGQAVFLPQTNAAGQHGSFSIDADGKWSYQLNNGDAAVQGLGAGKTLTETFTVTTADGTTGQVVVTIVGTNDAPVLTGKADGAVTEDGTLVATGKLDVSDVDTTDTHTWSVNNGGKGSYGSFSVDGSGNWTYNLDNANKDVQALKTGQSITESFTVTVDDGHGGKATQVVTVTINGTDDGAIITPAQPGDDKGTVTEDVTLSTGGQLTVTDPDAGQAVFLPQTNAAGQHGSFSIDADGKWSYQLNNGDAAVQGLGAGKTLTETFTVTTADGTTGQVVVTIVGTNDAPVLTGKADGAVTEDGTLVATGKLDVSDVDTTDTHTWSVNNGGKGSYGSFSVDGSGNWTYNLDNANKDVQALKTGQSITESFTVTVDDGHGGKATQVVTVTINGTDDGAIITPAQPGDDKGTVTEDVTLSTGGQLTVTDPDAGQAVFLPQTNAAGQHGSFSIDADGKWSYQLNNGDAAVQGLGAGKTLTETFTVTTADGTTGQVVVTIVGTNDAPVLTGKADGAVTEDGTLVATGKLDVSDVDTTDTHTWSVNNGGKGSYGSFSVDGSGNWTYNLDNANKDVQALKTGQSITESFTVTVDDGHGGKATQVVTVTINGTDDGAIITPAQPGDDKGTVTEDVTLSTGGQLTVTDPDAGQAVFLPQTNAAGQHGSFSIDADGKWSYQLNNGDAAVQGLGAGKTLTETFTVTTADGTTGQVVVTIVGTNDAPTISGTATGAVTEDAPQSSVSGQLSKLDVDTTDTHTWSVSNGGKGTYGSFVVDATGKWTYSLNNGDAKVQALAEGQKVTDSITVTVDDGHGGKATQVITITVTGANDAPTISGASTGAVTEDAAQSSISGQLTKTDVDATDTHTWSVSNDGKGTYGTFAVDSTGKWTYSLNNGDAKVQALADGQKVTDSITVTVDDGHGGKATQVITITVTGANDAPTISGASTGAVTEDAAQSSISGQLTKTDVDATDTHTWSVSNDGKGTYGTFAVDSTGKWTYSLNNGDAKVQALADGQKVTDSITVTVDDGHGGKATQVITITVTGANDAPTISGVSTGAVTEDAAQSSISGQLTKTDVDATDTHTWSVSNDGKGTYGTFAVDSTGKWTYSLNNGDAKVQALADGQKVTDSITVTVDDGHGGKATQVITITVTGANDAPTISGASTGAVTEDAAQSSISGQLTKTDVDATDTHTWSVSNDGKGTYGTFAVDSTGKWTYSLNNGDAKVQALADGQKVTDSITVTVDDGHGGKATQVITITVTGANDAPTISGTATGAVTEDAPQSSVSGQLSKLDVDTTDTHTWSVSNGGKGTYGSFVVDATGKWTYSLNNGDAKVQALAEGQKVTDSITVTVDDGHGGTATQVVTVTITGTNDAPTIGGQVSGSVKEDVTQVATGQLTKTDVDATDTHTWSVSNAGKGTYGSFVIDSTGKWTYSLDNASTKVQALADGQQVQDTITVTVSDGKGGTATQVITVTVTGTNDVPTIGGVTTGSVTEDGTLTTSGQLTKTDVDATDTHTWSLSNAGAGTYGTFTVDASGKWTYNLDNGSTKVQALAAGQQVQDTITVTVNDGHGGTATQVVTVTVTGANDAPTISGTATGAVKEDGTLNATGQLTKTDVDATDTHTWAVSNSGVGTYGTFIVDSTGKWTYALNNNSAGVQGLKEGQQVTDTINVTVSDGKGGTATQPITITISGTNDVPTVTNDAKSVTEDTGVSGGKLSVNGAVTIADADAGESNFNTSSLKFTGSTYTGGQLGAVTINADGTYTYKVDNAAVQFLKAGQSIVETYTVASADGKATSTISITINGTNDVPTVTNDAKSVIEDVGVSGGKLSVNGAVTISDADTGESTFNTNSLKFTGSTYAGGQLGAVTINADGTYTYKVDNAAVQFLKAGQSIVETYTVASADGTATSTITITINGANDAFPDINTTTEDHAVSGNVLLNDEGYVSGGTLVVASFAVNGVTYSVGSSSVSVMDAGKVVGTITVAANGGYVFTPSSDWSGKVPTVTYTTNTGVTSTLDINVTPVADTPLVTVNVGAGSTPVTTSITATSVNSSNAGHTVTAYNINGSKGSVSVVTGTDHDGFGVVGAASGDSTEIGRSSTGSESLAIQFNVPVTAITVQFAWLASGEWARYQMFDEAKKPVVLGYNADGTVNAASGLYGFVKGGTDKVDTQFKLSVPAGSTISQIVFDAPRVDDDYLINKVTYTTATTYPVTITATPQDVDYSEAITKVTVEVPKGVTLSAGTQIDATHWSLPLVSNGSYSVSIDPITKAVTITGLNMTVPENVQVNEIKVVAVVADGSSTADGSASFTSKPDAVDDTNSATLTSKSVATAPTSKDLATFTSGESNAWKFDNTTGTRLYKTDSNLSSSNWQSGENTKWLVSSVNGTTWDGISTGGGLVLTDNNGRASGDAKAVTPIYTSTVAGTTLQFKVTGFSNASNSSDSVNWTLYKSTDGGVTWSAVPGQANSGVITGTGTYTTTALEADATYRILLTVHEGNSNSTDAAVTFDDFTANVPNPDTIVWSSTAVTGSVTSNDTLGTLGETSTLSVFNGSTWVNAASGGTTITGSYGTLLIKADGSYTYTPTASAAGAGKVEHFDYKLTQADGDTDTASLDISIDATGPGATTLAASRIASDTGSHEVHSTSSGDSLLGTAEDDLFIWHQGDAGTVSSPVTDVVKNFGASGKDALDLGDLLQGEETSSDLSKFLHLETRTEADGKTIDTVIKVSTAGALDANGNGFNQKILVEGVDLVGTSHDQNALIKQLIDQGKLKIDHS